MAYSRPPAKTAGDTFDITAYNAIRDSLIASAPDVFTTKGDLFVATGADAGTRLAAGANDSILVADSSAASGLAWQKMPFVKVTKTVAQDPTIDTWETVTFDAEDYDTDGMHSNATNNHRLTVPSGGAGIYHVIANIGFDTSTLVAGTSGQYGVRILLDGTTTIADWFDEAEMQSKDIWASLVIPISLTAAQFVVCQAWTSQDVNLITESQFAASWMRRQ